MSKLNPFQLATLDACIEALQTLKNTEDITSQSNVGMFYEKLQPLFYAYEIPRTLDEVEGSLVQLWKVLGHLPNAQRRKAT